MARDPRDNFDSGVVADRVRSLVTRNIQDNVKFLGRVAEVVRAAASQARQSPGRPGDVVSSWLNMNVRLYSLVNEQSRSFLHQALNVVEDSLGIESADAASASAEHSAPVELLLEGAPGETVQTGFQVENCHAYPAAVNFEFHAPASGTAIPASAVKARALKLEGGARGIAHIEVTIARNWQPDELRGCLVRMTGFEAPPVALRLKVLPPRKVADTGRATKKKTQAAPRKKPAKAASRKKTAKKRKA